MKPKLKLSLDNSLSCGTGECRDADGRFLGSIRVPRERPLPGTAELFLSIEDYFAVMRMTGRITVSQ